MSYKGDMVEDQTFYFSFNTENDLGALITLAGTPSLLFYKNDETGTETATGLTLTVDHDGVVGVHNVKAVLTDALLVTGADYRVQIGQGTVDGVDKTGSVVAEFSIENRFGADVAAIKEALLPTQNAAFNDLEFLFVDSTDHVTPVTGASGTAVTRSIDGGAFGSATGTLAEVGNGIYQFDASAADMNGRIITFRFTASGGTPNAPDDAFLTIITSGI